MFHMRFFLFTRYTYDTWNNIYDVWKSLKNIEYPNVWNVLIEMSSQTPLGYVQEPLLSVKDRVMKLTEFGCTTGNKRVGLVPIKTNVGCENQPEKKRNILSQALQTSILLVPACSSYSLWKKNDDKIFETFKYFWSRHQKISNHTNSRRKPTHVPCMTWLEISVHFPKISKSEETEWTKENLQATSLFFQSIIWKV